MRPSIIESLGVSLRISQHGIREVFDVTIEIQHIIVMSDRRTALRCEAKTNLAITFGMPGRIDINTTDNQT